MTTKKTTATTQKDLLNAYSKAMAKEARNQEIMGRESAKYQGLDGVQDAIVSLLERGEEIRNPIHYLNRAAKRQAKRRVYQGGLDFDSLSTLSLDNKGEESSGTFDIRDDGEETTATALHDYIYDRLLNEHSKTLADIYDSTIYRAIPFRLLSEEYKKTENESKAVTRQRIRNLKEKVGNIILNKFKINELFDTGYVITSNPGTCKSKFVEIPEENGMVTVWDKDQIEHYKPTPRALQAPEPDQWKNCNMTCTRKVSKTM